MHLVDNRSRNVQTTAAARRFAQMPIDLARTPQTGLGGGPDIRVAMPVADTNVHAATVYE